MSKKTPTHSFTVVLRRLDANHQEIEDSLFETGCDDGLVGLRNGAVYVDFERAADSFEDAVLSAIEAVEASSIGARVSHVEPGDLVTAAEIARRVGNSRESVRLWMEGERGPGDFPLPVSGVSGSLVLWSWAEVARWLSSTGRLIDEQLHQAEVVADVNGALEERECSRHSNRRHSFLKRLGGTIAPPRAPSELGRRTSR